MSYANVAQLREYLSQVPTGATQDAQLQATLDRAHEIVTEALSFEFQDWPAEASERDVPGSGSVWLQIPAYKPGSITQVLEVAGRGLATESTETVTEYVVEPDGRLFCAYGWRPWRYYRVTAIWGYGPAPASVVEVELEIAVNIWRSRDAAGFGTMAGVEGQGATAYNRALTWAQRSILDGVRARYLGVVHA